MNDVSLRVINIQTTEYVILGSVIILLLPILFIIIAGVLAVGRKIRSIVTKLCQKHKQHVPQRNLTPELHDYYRALEMQNADAMICALHRNAAKCPNRNSWCLTEVFCPECPMANGGLAVQSGRAGMEDR